MFNKNDRVAIDEITRTRTIFQNSEVTPGITKTSPVNAQGVITNIFDDMGMVSYEVKLDGKPDGKNFIEVLPSEIKIA